MLLHWLSHVPKKSAAHVAHVVTLVLAIAQQVIVVVAHVAPQALTQPPLTVAISPPVQEVMPNPPLSAYAQSPRQLQQLTVNKE